MASSSTAALAQWQRIETLVQSWLDERQQLIVMLCTMQGLRGLSGQSLPLHHQVQQFCQLLMDYISAGYFEVYQSLVEEARHLHHAQPVLTDALLQKLDLSTDEALAFDADFGSRTRCLAQKAQLPERISDLMQTLEDRFALEDQLILSVHRHSTPVLRQAIIQ